nr:AF4/FMR2 family member 1 [Microcebus murinus]
MAGKSKPKNGWDRLPGVLDPQGCARFECFAAREAYVDLAEAAKDVLIFSRRPEPEAAHNGPGGADACGQDPQSASAAKERHKDFLRPPSTEKVRASSGSPRDGTGQAKVAVSNLWSAARLVHLSFPHPSDKTVSPGGACSAKLQRLRPAWVAGKRPIRLHDNDPAACRPASEADRTALRSCATSTAFTLDRHDRLPLFMHRDNFLREDAPRPAGDPRDSAQPFPVPSLPNGHARPGKPPGKPDRQQADDHMREAKRLKQKAESMTDKVGKAFKYLEAVLAFIECGVAMESDSPACRAAYSVYADAVDLIKFVMSLKPFSEATSTQEKIFAVLCMRCQSILNMAMFRCKKDIAIKYSRTLSDHFVTSSRAAQAPSPCLARSSGAPSPRSPAPSQASGAPGSAPAAMQSVTSPYVSTPAAIQSMTSSYVAITSHVLAAFDLWERADALTRRDADFFSRLSASACSLALGSSLADLVRYTRQGFQQLR